MLRRSRLIIMESIEMAFTLPVLPYAYDALEPHIDAQTMEIHYTKHHQTYINNLNAAVEGTEFAEWPVEKLVAAVQQLPCLLYTSPSPRD